MYNKKKLADLESARVESDPPPPLFDVSTAYAHIWVKQQLKDGEAAQAAGVFNVACAKHAETLSDELKASATLSTIFEDTVVLPAQTDVESAQVDEGPTCALDLKPSLTCVTKATSIKKMSWPTKSWVPCLEAEDRKRWASNVLTELGLDKDVCDRTRR